MSFLPTLSYNLIDQLRAIFFPKDRSVVLDNDCFIGFNEQDTPLIPLAGQLYLYPKADGNFYKLDEWGNEVLIDYGAGSSSYFFNLLDTDNGSQIDFTQKISHPDSPVSTFSRLYVWENGVFYTKLPSGVYAPLSMGNGNLLPNYGFQVNQEGAGAVTSNLAYPCDGWLLGLITDTVSLQKIVNTDNKILSPNHLHLILTAKGAGAGDISGIQSQVEGQYLQKGYNVGYYLSFKAKSSDTSAVFNATIRLTLSTPGFASYVMDFQVSQANVWEEFFFAIPAHNPADVYTDENWAMTLWFTAHSGATFQTAPNVWTAGNYIASTNHVALSNTDTLDIADVMLKIGQAPAPYEPPDDVAEEIKALRYFHKMGEGMIGVWGSAAIATLSGTFPVHMRTTPGLTLLSATPTIQEIFVLNRVGVASTISASSVNIRGCHVQIDGFAGATAQNGARPILPQPLLDISAR